MFYQLIRSIRTCTCHLCSHWCHCPILNECGIARRQSQRLCRHCAILHNPRRRIQAFPCDGCTLLYFLLHAPTDSLLRFIDRTVGLGRIVRDLPSQGVNTVDVVLHTLQSLADSTHRSQIRRREHPSCLCKCLPVRLNLVSHPLRAVFYMIRVLPELIEMLRCRGLQPCVEFLASFCLLCAPVSRRRRCSVNSVKEASSALSICVILKFFLDRIAQTLSI